MRTFSNKCLNSRKVVLYEYLRVYMVGVPGVEPGFEPYKSPRLTDILYAPY